MEKLNNLVCPYCNNKITNKDLKYLRCIKCKKSFIIGKKLSTLLLHKNLIH